MLSTLSEHIINSQMGPAAEDLRTILGMGPTVCADDLPTILGDAPNDPTSRSVNILFQQLDLHPNSIAIICLPSKAPPSLWRLAFGRSLKYFIPDK